MPIDLEMLLSAWNHSFFPCSPFHSMSYSDSNFHRSLSFPETHCIPRSLEKRGSLFYKKPNHDDYVSIEPYKSKEDAVVRDELSFGVRKKRVSFADDRGFNLVEVREIPGAPKWADDVITLLIGDAKCSVVKEKKWKVAFEHPPWPDEDLVQKLEQNMIALEHISVKEGADDILVGTVKVKNLAYEKDIFVRVTFDRWLSYVDIPCTYVKRNEKIPKPNMYDTFNFSTKILPIASRYEVIEFCLCFKCDGKVHWDNNGGINYRLIAEHSKSCVPDIQPATNVKSSSSDELSQQYISLPDYNKHSKQIDIWSEMMKNETYW